VLVREAFRAKLPSGRDFSLSRLALQDVLNNISASKATRILYEYSLSKHTKCAPSKETDGDRCSLTSV